MFLMFDVFAQPMLGLKHEGFTLRSIDAQASSGDSTWTPGKLDPLRKVSLRDTEKVRSEENSFKKGIRYPKFLQTVNP